MGIQHLICIIFRVESDIVWIHALVDLVIHLLEEFLGKVLKFLALGEKRRKEESDFLLAEFCPVVQQIFESKKLNLETYLSFGSSGRF